MAIRYAEPAAPAKPLLKQAKEIRRQAEALEVGANELLAEKRRRGRQPSGNETVTLRVDKRAVEFFKTYGDDWKKAMADALARAAHL
ncbi:BrnA antitoxin family protein [Rhizobium leguminosarum]|uniref:BrnA antitoxin family protein n=1 Tax=Rhizobium leguminosarum TaxID=384 RepID=UPI0004BC6D80|nr:BrnA antitoxin family protein [Rhizobium leguminosarum]